MDEEKKERKNTALFFCAKQRKNVKRLAVSMISMSGVIEGKNQKLTNALNSLKMKTESPNG